MSTVEQRAEVTPRRARRLVTRTLLVLGGALAATAAAWAVSTATASADALPPSQPLPITGLANASTGPADQVTNTLGGSVTGALGAVRTAAPADGALPAAAAALPVPVRMAVPVTVPVDVPVSAGQWPHSPAGLDVVTDQVRSTVSGVGDRLAPNLTPAGTLIAAGGVSNRAIGHPISAAVPQSARAADQSAVATVRATGFPQWVGPFPLRAGHTPRGPTGVTDRAIRPIGAGWPTGSSRHLPPAYPVMPPSGNSDSGTHAGGGVPGGSGPGQIVFGRPADLPAAATATGDVPQWALTPGDTPGTTPD